MGPGLRVQPKASQKKAASEVAWKWWTHPETLLLISVWGDTLAEHCEDYKGKRILPSAAYDRIAAKLKDQGIKRSVGQIREKIKTLKKSYWGAQSSGAQGLSGKRASVIEMMRRVLQANGNMTKGKYMRKTELKGPKPRTKRSKGHEEEDIMDTRAAVEAEADAGHVHGSSVEWSSEEAGPPEEGLEGAPGYNYPPLCQLVEGLVDKFLLGQRESEERFLALEEKRAEGERERWGALEGGQHRLLSATLRTYERWRQEDQEQERRLWVMLGAPSPSPSPLAWHLKATLHPSASSSKEDH